MDKSHFSCECVNADHLESLVGHAAAAYCSPEEIYKYLTETDKLAQWWTTDTQGSGAKVGDTLEFRFYGFCQKFNVKELKPGKRVAWISPKGQDAECYEAHWLMDR